MKNLSYFILFFSCACHAGDYNFYREVNDDTEETFDSAISTARENDSILHNLFFQDDRWRVYNYTAYQTNQFNQKMLTGDTSNLSLR